MPSIEILYQAPENDGEVWQSIATAYVRDLIEKHFDGDLERAAEAQYEANQWKGWAKSCLEDGIEPPEKPELAEDWVGFAQAYKELKADVECDGLKMPEIKEIQFWFRGRENDHDRER